MNKIFCPTRIFLIVTILCCILLGWVDLNYYPQLSQGDHGRDLYSAQEILRGKMPYKDFWWVYGPLMPFYFAIFYKFTGGTIVSFLIGKLVLKTACAAFFFLAAARFIPLAAACIASLWFFQSQQDFFFTFNHIGGITAELAILFLLFAYIRTRNVRFAWLTLPLIFLYCLIKINFGLAALVATGVCVAAVDFFNKQPFDNERKKFALAAVFAVPALTALVYGVLLNGLTIHEIRQCMPYFGDDQPHHFSPAQTIPYYFEQHWLTIVHSWMDMTAVWGKLNLPGGIGGNLDNRNASGITSTIGILLVFVHTANMLSHVLIHGSTITVTVQALRRRFPPATMKEAGLAVFMLGVFFVLNFHEFVVSGVWYRTFWSLPFLIMFNFLMIALALRSAPKWFRVTAWAMLAFIIAVRGFFGAMETESMKIPPRFLGGPHGHVFIGNEFEWTSTVNTVGSFLQQNLHKDEYFFALPYDDIYYYITGRESPTRQLIYFDHIKIPPEQEIRIIAELESKNVAYVLLSNRMASSETGLGIFGKTYCPLIAQYINAKYAPIARQGGTWNSEPGWGNNHGVMIFKKK